jgi:hypothetical protein
MCPHTVIEEAYDADADNPSMLCSDRRDLPPGYSWRSGAYAIEVHSCCSQADGSRSPDPYYDTDNSVGHRRTNDFAAVNFTLVTADCNNSSDWRIG